MILPNPEKHIVTDTTSIRKALEYINEIDGNSSRTLFVLDKQKSLVGSITDGDIRRSLLKNSTVDDTVQSIMNKDYKFIVENRNKREIIKSCRKLNIQLIPIVSTDKKLLHILDISDLISSLPVDAIIMAGGEGKRLRPKTENTPKPLLLVGDKPIIEHNIDRLIKFGIENINITIKYLGNQLIDFFEKNKKPVNIVFQEEEKKLGTIGGIHLIQNIYSDFVLVMNSDLLTDINYDEFYQKAIDSKADLLVATIPYRVNVPYAVLSTEGDNITKLSEKPTYTYHSNAGIYLIKKEMIEFIPKNEFFNATDLIEILIQKGKSVKYYDIVGYWLDIGKHEDYEKANQDISHLDL